MDERVSVVLRDGIAKTGEGTKGRKVMMQILKIGEPIDHLSQRRGKARKNAK
jgi:hypothetical protein